MSKFSQFMEKLVHEVTEGQQCARRVRLMCEGTVFETWEPIQGGNIDPEVWGNDAETLIQALLPELPKRRLQLSIIAEDGAGASMATLLHTVTGQNASAQDLGTQNGAKALADGIASVAKTADAVLDSARRMLDYQQTIIDKQNQQLFDYHELFMAVKKADLDDQEQGNAVTKIIGEQVKDAAPMLLALLEHVVKSPPKVANGASTVASAVTTIANGAH